MKTYCSCMWYSKTINIHRIQKCQFKSDQIQKNLENQKLLKFLDKITMRLTQVLIMILIGVVARQSSFKKICSKEICSKCARLFIYETSPTIKKIWWVSKFESFKLYSLWIKFEMTGQRINELENGPSSYRVKTQFLAQIALVLMWSEIWFKWTCTNEIWLLIGWLFLVRVHIDNNI